MSRELMLEKIISFINSKVNENFDDIRISLDNLDIWFLNCNNEYGTYIKVSGIGVSDNEYGVFVGDTHFFIFDEFNDKEIEKIYKSVLKQ